MNKGNEKLVSMILETLSEFYRINNTIGWKILAIILMPFIFIILQVAIIRSHLFYKNIFKKLYAKSIEYYPISEDMRFELTKKAYNMITSGDPLAYYRNRKTLDLDQYIKKAFYEM